MSKAAFYPPFVPIFGTGAPGATVPHNTLYFDTSTNPFTAYVYSTTAGAWKTFGALGSGVNASAIQGIAVSNTPPTDGQVLTYNATNNDIEWISGSGGGGGGITLMPQGASTFAYSFAAIGNILTPDANILVKSIAAYFNTVTGGIYKLGIAQCTTAGVLTSNPNYTASYTETNGQARNIAFNMPAPYAMTAGNTYVIFWVRTDSTTTVSQTTRFVNGASVIGLGATYNSTGTACHVASLSPTIGDTFSSAGGGVFDIGIAYSLN